MGDVLEEHGTDVGGLKPGSVVYAAKVDLARRRRNKNPYATEFEHYAFHRRHVSKASSARELIELALANLDAGLKSGKKSTRLIYRDRAVLEAALSMLKQSDDVWIEEYLNWGAPGGKRG